ncbi:MAG: hypothetical protein UY21_C0014G0005 [Microgenomates group bacterium GW2011_GWA1_48_10]|nr:MAG: hypothetical protein UY21_C0014G0005 [Microgenomates group bacterium GW2011_GWA1_48_10]
MPHPKALAQIRSAPGSPYHLYDNFANNLATGAVNGTLATSAGKNVTGTTTQRTRTVVETTAQTSITSGTLSFADGNDAYGDPILRYGAFTRTTGLMIIGEVTPNTAASQVSGLGWTNVATPTAATDFEILNFQCNNNRFVARDNSSATAVGESDLVVGTTYQVCVILRGGVTGGVHWLIKGGVYKYWTLLFTNNQDSTSTMYPCVLSVDNAITFRNIRVPTTCWLPVPFADDGFALTTESTPGTRTDGQELDGTVTDGLGHQEGAAGSGLVGGGGNGVTWSSTTGVYSVNSFSGNGKAVGSPTLGAELSSGTLTVGSWYEITASQTNYFYTGSAVGDTFVASAATALDANNKVKLITLSSMFATITGPNPDNLQSVDITCGSRQQAGLVFNLDSRTDPQNFILLYVSRLGSKIWVDEYVSGTRTSLVNTAFTYGASAALRGIIQRNSTNDAMIFAAYYNNVIVGSTLTTVTYNTNLLYGLFTTRSGDGTNFNSFNNWGLRPRGTANEYGFLDSL